MAFRKCSCSSVLVAITKPTPRTRRQSSKINKHHAFCNQWAIECNYQYKRKIDRFYQEDDNFYYVIPYKQEQYLVDFERFVNVSRKLSKYVHANSEFLDLYNDKSFPSRDIFKIPFYSHDSTGIDIQPKVVAEFVNWINGADGDYRREDNRQAILVGHINEYMQLFALAMLYDIPALWNWCVKEVSCLPIEASEAHIAKRKYMNMGDLVHDQETYTYWPYTVPEGHYTRLPRACMNEDASAELSQRSLTELSAPSSAQLSQPSSTQFSQPSTAGLSQPSSAELSQPSSSRLSQLSSVERSQPFLAEPTTIEAIPEASTLNAGIPKTSPHKVSAPKLGTFRVNNPKASTHVTKPQSRCKKPSSAPRTRRPASKGQENNLAQVVGDLDDSSSRQQTQDMDSGYGTASPEHAARLRAMMEAEEGSANSQPVTDLWF